MAKAFVAKTAIITGVTLTGFVDVSVDNTATPLDIKDDAKQYQTACPLLHPREMIAVSLRNPNHAISVGATGSAIFHSATISNGIDSDGTYTCTCAKVVVVGVHRGIDQEGYATSTISLVVLSSDGESSGIVWSTGSVT